MKIAVETQIKLKTIHEFYINRLLIKLNFIDDIKCKWKEIVYL